MIFRLPYVWLLAVFLFVHAERSTVQITNDDVNDGRVKTSVCKTAIFNLCQVQPGNTLRLNETISCLFDQIDWLDTEGTCYMYLSSVVANMVDECVTDQGTFCSNVTSSTAVLTCLASHYYAVSQPCSTSIELLLGNIIPCVSEANTYCSTETVPVKIMHCLNNTVVNNADNFSPACLDMVHKYSIASPTVVDNETENGSDDAANGGQWEEWSEDHDDDGGDDGSTSGTSDNEESGSRKKRNKAETDDAKTPFEDTEPESLAEESYFTVVGALFLLITLLILFRCIRACFVGANVDVRAASMARSVDPDAIDNKGSYVRASSAEDDPAEDVLL